MSTTVRPAAAADNAFLVEMARLACTIEDRPLPAPDAAEVQKMLPQPTDPAVVAWDEHGRPIGAAWLFTHEPALVREPDGKLLPELAMAVVAEQRNKGVGSTIIEALAAEAKRRGINAISLNVHLRNPAARLYTRTGFRVAGAGRGWFGVAMVRRLDAEG